MKIYQVNVVCGIGSTGRIVVDLKKQIEKRGHECRIAYGRGKKGSTSDAVRIETVPELYIHASYSKLTGKQGLLSSKATKRLIKDIDKYNPDVIHLHNIHGYYLNYKSFFVFLKGYGKPIVWTMHDCWAFTGKCAHYDAVGCTQWREGCKICPHLELYPSSILGKNVEPIFARKKSSFTGVPLTIVTPSKWLQKQVKQSFLKEQRCIVIPNGIALDLFYPRDSHIRKKLHCDNRIMLLGVASVWTNSKGYEDFIKLRSLLGDIYVICMVGLTEKQIEQLPIGMIGIQKTESLEKLAELYSAADAFINLTYEDTFPTTNIEALACGTPVITYRAGGSPEIIDDSCGEVAAKGNLDEIMKCISRLKERPYDEQACLKRAAIFSVDDFCDSYVALYETLPHEELR